MSLLIAGEEALVADELEGWDVVRPILPPPPSATEDVEQYARALYEQQHPRTTANNSSGVRTGSAGSIGLGAGVGNGSNGLASTSTGGMRPGVGGGMSNNSGSGGAPSPVGSTSGGAGTPTPTASSGMARLGSMLRGGKS